MDPLTVSGLLTVGSKLIDRLFPDKEAADKAKLALFEMQQRGDLAELNADVRLALGQMEVNKVEAAAGAFRGGWRPAAGWACSIGLAYHVLGQPLLAWISTFNGWEPPPVLDVEVLVTMLGGMLGIGASRTVEKLRGLP